jgi:hypothetical protein
MRRSSRSFVKCIVTSISLLGAQTLWALPSQPSCQPVVQMAYAAALDSSKISFVQTLGLPSIIDAQINTRACRELNWTMSLLNYKRTQEFASSAQYSLFKVQRKNQIVCATGAFSVQEFERQRWRVDVDSCWQNPTSLKKFVSLDGRNIYYMNNELVSYLKIVKASGRAEKLR